MPSFYYFTVLLRARNPRNDKKLEKRVDMPGDNENNWNGEGSEPHYPDHGSYTCVEAVSRGCHPDRASENNWLRLGSSAVPYLLAYCTAIRN